MRFARPLLAAVVLGSITSFGVVLTPSTASAAKVAVGDAEAQQADPNTPYEDPNKTYYFGGIRYRETIMPSFIYHLFASGGPSSVQIPQAGLEFGMRHGGAESIFGISYASYAMGQTPFKGKDEGDESYELVTSHLKMINLTADLLWSTLFNDQWSFQYGVSTGIGIVFGDLNRVQATPPGGGTAAGNPYTYVPCVGPGNPNAAYCDNSNNHYGSYSEPSWLSGGSKPIVYPTLGPELGFRYKPIKQLVFRLDGGFNIFSGFFGDIAIAMAL